MSLLVTCRLVSRTRSCNQYKYLLHASKRFSSRTDPEEGLRANVKTLGTMLGNVIKVGDPAAFEAFEKLSTLGAYIKLSSFDMFRFRESLC
jgi:hypothetical protein